MFHKQDFHNYIVVLQGNNTVVIFLMHITQSLIKVNLFQILIFKKSLIQ